MAHDNEQTISESLGDMARGIRRLGILYFEKARLKTTEKITILLATIAFSAVMMALGLVFFVFVSIGVGHYLATTIAPHLAYLIVAGFYLLLFVVIAGMRRRLFVDPIARFMSRLLVEDPEDVRAERVLGDEEKTEAADHVSTGNNRPGAMTVDIAQEEEALDDDFDERDALTRIDKSVDQDEKGGAQ